MQYKSATGIDYVSAATPLPVTLSGTIPATITDDTTTNATMYLTWVTAATGNLPIKVSSTKLSFNPSTGALAVGGPIGGTTLTSTVTGATSPVVISNLSTATTLGLLTFNNTFTGSGCLGIAGGGGSNIMYFLVPSGGSHNFLVNNASVASISATGALTTNSGLQTFGANDSGGAGFRLVVVPNA